jgi:16S rRNA (adenine1518-N6/adenine1519-N6)-dimethyltransferase
MGARYGQHFLHDKNFLQCFLKVGNYSKKDLLIEIGPGKGTLTEIFLNQVKKIIAIEIDPNLVSFLKKKFSACKDVSLIQRDILQINFNELINDKNSFDNIDVVGNLPYYLATKLLLKLLINYHSLFRSFTFMFQKEVGERIISPPKTKNYAYLSVVTQFFSDVKVVKVASPSMFSPKPKVSGIILFFKLKTNFSIKKKDFFLYFFFLRVIFF